MSFLSLLRQSITVKNPTGAKDLHGKETLGSSATVKCRFERVYKVITTAERDKVPIQAQAVVPASASVSIGAQVTFGTDKYRVMVRNDAPGKNGSIHHYELMLQEWEFQS